MTNTIIDQTPDTDNAPVRVKTNNRGEEQFESVRHYECDAEACSSYGSGHVLEWDEPMRHTAYEGKGENWGIAVQWWPREEKWTVSGEYRDPDCGHLNRHESGRFVKALNLAHDVADLLNSIQAEDA